VEVTCGARLLHPSAGADSVQSHPAIQSHPANHHVQQEVTCGAKFLHPSAGADNVQSHPANHHVQQVSGTPSVVQSCPPEVDMEQDAHQSVDHSAAHGADYHE